MQPTLLTGAADINSITPLLTRTSHETSPTRITSLRNQCAATGNKTQKRLKHLKSLMPPPFPLFFPSPSEEKNLHIFLDKERPFDSHICKLYSKSLQSQGITSTCEFSVCSDPAEHKLALLRKHTGTARDDWLYRKHHTG